MHLVHQADEQRQVRADVNPVMSPGVSLFYGTTD